MANRAELELIKAVLGELRDFRDEYRDDRKENQERFAKVEEDVSKVKQEIASAKLLGRAALGVAAMCGAFMTWAADLINKVPALGHKLLG